MSAIHARCAASQQSIARGDACRIVFIAQAASYRPIQVEHGSERASVTGISNTSVYPDCFWQPVSAFIRAVYDDFGTSRLVLDTPLARAQVVALFDTLFRKSVLTLEGENRCHERRFDFPDFVRANAPGLTTVLEPLDWSSPPVHLQGAELDDELQTCWAYLCDHVRRHRVFTARAGAPSRPLATHIVHERAYQALVEDLSTRRDWDGESLELAAFVRRALAAGRRHSEEVAAEAGDEAEFVEGVRKMAFTDGVRDYLSRLNAGDCRTDAVARRLLDRALCAVTRGQVSEEAFVEQAVVWLADRAVVASMERHKLTFTPMTYVAADFSNNTGRAYAAFVTKVCEQVCADRGELERQ